MTDIEINLSDHPELMEALKNDPEAKEVLENIVSSFANSEQGQLLRQRLSFINLTKEIFEAMLLIVCVSVNRIQDHEKIHNMVAPQVADFIADSGIFEKALLSEKQCHRSLRHVMLRTRALTEDALDIPRYDKTEKGADTPCPK